MKKVSLLMKECWIRYECCMQWFAVIDSSPTKDCVAGLSRLGVGLGSVINEDLVVEEGDSDEGVEESFELAAEDFTDIAEVSETIFLAAEWALGLWARIRLRSRY